MDNFAPKVFISYSHDSRAHSDRVLALAQQLRRDGIDAELDQFHQCELVHWPRWCEEQMRTENSDFVLAVCTGEYRRRVEGRVAADVGKGVFWEATLIYNYLYDAKGNPRFIPVYFKTADESTIPSVLAGYSRFCLDKLSFDDDHSGYALLYRLLTGRFTITKAAIGIPLQLPPLVEEIRQTDFLALIEQIDAKIDAIGSAIGAINQEQKGQRELLEEIVAFTRQIPSQNELLTPQQRYEQAISEVAFKHDLTTQGLRSAIDAWTAQVKADPQASPYDLALAEYKANHFDKAAEQAGIAYDLAMQARQQATDEAIKAARLEGDAQFAAVQYELALAAYRKAAALTDEVLDPLDWADEQSRVANTLHDIACYSEAEPLLRDILSIREQHNGLNHPETATALNNLALLLKDTNRLAEAEPLLRRALAIDETSYGSDPQNVAIRLNNLAQLLKDINRQAEAEPLMRRALMIAETVYGQVHPDVARHLNNLAALLHDTNRLAEAEPLMRRALCIDEASCGQDHPNVARDLNNLVVLLQATNRLAEAEPLIRRALVIDEASFGRDHPNVAIGLNNLAQLLKATNRLAEAEPLMRRAIAIDESSFGLEHPNVSGDLNNLAQLLQDTNRLAEAEPLMRRALAIDEKVYEPDHPIVAIRLNNLAQLLQDTSRLDDAEPLMRRAWAIDEASFGPDHPGVAGDLNNLAFLLQRTNRLVEAEPLSRRVVSILLCFQIETGYSHPHFEDAVDSYIQLLQAMGRSEAQIQAELSKLQTEAQQLAKQP